MDNSASNNSGCRSLLIENNKKLVNDYIDQNTSENTKKSNIKAIRLFNSTMESLNKLLSFIMFYVDLLF